MDCTDRWLRYCVIAALVVGGVALEAAAQDTPPPGSKPDLVPTKPEASAPAEPAEPAEPSAPVEPAAAPEPSAPVEPAAAPGPAATPEPSAPVEPSAAPAAPGPAATPEPDTPAKQVVAERVPGPAELETPATVTPSTSADVDDGATETEASEGTDQAADSGDVEEIVVTGSRIKRNSFDMPTPVQVMNRDQIQKSGASNMADLIRFMTANSGSATSFGLAQGSTGSANFNLRGLGIANTLVLLNGRRLVPYPDSFGVANSNSFSDVNQIPLEFIERVEIAKGGASAIYGSDAIAGVVNIILRKDYEGAAINMRGQTTTGWDQQDGTVSAIVGANSEKSSVVAQFSYFKRAPLAARDRDFTEGTLESGVGQPGTIIAVNEPEPVLDAAGNPVLNADGTPMTMPTPSDYYQDPACGAPGSTSRAGGRYCMFSFRNDWNLANEQERFLAYVTGDHRAADFFQLFGEVGFARKETIIPISPSYPLLRSVMIPNDHPDLIAQFPEVGARPAIFFGRPFGRAAGSAQQTIELDGYRAVGGVRGELDQAGMADWSYELALTWAMNEFNRRNPDIIFDRFQEAVGNCSDPNDLSGCFNPFYSAIDGSGTENSAEIVDYVDGQYKNMNLTTMLVADVGMAGPLLALPGGDLSVAFGGQIRRNQQSVENDNDAEDAAYAYLIGDRDWRGTQDVVAGFLEFSVPLMRGAELQAAMRAEHYQDIATSVNPKIGLSWRLSDSFQMPSVFEKLRVRGSWGTAFRAPNLFQTYGTVTNREQFSDPSPMFRGVLTGPAPEGALKPETSEAFNLGVEWVFSQLRVDLDYWHYNVTDLITRDSAQAKLSDCRQAQGKRGAPFADVDECADFNVIPGTPDTWSSVNVSYSNQSEITTSGIDFTFQYSLDMGPSAGELRFGASGTYTMSYLVPASVVPDQSLDPDNDPTTPSETAAQDGCSGDECDIAGKRNQRNFARPLPRLRARFPIGYTLDGHSINLAANYIGNYGDDASYDPQTGELKSVPAWLTLDMSYTYILGDSLLGSETLFQVGVVNLIGSDPPKLDDNFGYDIFTHDARGRMVYGNLQHKF